VGRTPFLMTPNQQSLFHGWRVASLVLRPALGLAGWDNRDPTPMRSASLAAYINTGGRMATWLPHQGEGISPSSWAFATLLCFPFFCFLHYAM
jgi:hypothetical protein